MSDESYLGPSIIAPGFSSDATKRVGLKSL
jgi:hypothetical protein